MVGRGWEPGAGNEWLGNMYGYKRSPGGTFGVAESVLYLDYINANVLLVILYYCFSRCYY